MQTSEIYSLSLHDALPIFGCLELFALRQTRLDRRSEKIGDGHAGNLARILESHEKAAPGTFIGVEFKKDRKSTRLNSSHTVISYAVFCLKKKNKHVNNQRK